MVLGSSRTGAMQGSAHCLQVQICGKFEDKLLDNILLSKGLQIRGVGFQFKFVENLRMNCWTIFYCQKGSKLGGKFKFVENLRMNCWSNFFNLKLKFNR